MPYHSTISFTLDTICPWTYLAKRRLDEALRRVCSSQSSSTSQADQPGVTFTLHFLPFQLYPEASKEGEGKYEWYKKSKYGDSDEKMDMYIQLMTAYGASAGIDFKFGGTVANTLDAHRLIWWTQQQYPSTTPPPASLEPSTAEKVVESLYAQYFTEEAHPSSPSTLLAAASAAGIPEAQAAPFIQDEYDGLMDVKMLIREQIANGVDAVPYVVIEGRKRDFTLTGAKEVEEYVRALEQVIKESG